MFLFNAQAITVYLALATNMYTQVHLFSDKWRLIEKSNEVEPK